MNSELELELEREHQEYEDLTAKYDLLEEDYVVIKGKLVLEKEAITKYAFFKNKLLFLCVMRDGE